MLRDQQKIYHVAELNFNFAVNIQHFQLGPHRTQFNSTVSQNTVSMTHHRLRLMLSHVRKGNSEAIKASQK